MNVEYLQLIPGTTPPELNLSNPFHAVVVSEHSVTPVWQYAVSRWLVASGCLYMMAWGIECSSWDDSVDHANLEEHDYGDIPDNKLVMTTWHEKDTLLDVFNFAKHNAIHADSKNTDTLILHVCSVSKENEYLLSYGNV